MPVHEIDPPATSPEVVVRIVGAGAPLCRAPVPITFPDKTSGFNGIEVYDLKYCVCRPHGLDLPVGTPPDPGRALRGTL